MTLVTKTVAIIFSFLVFVSLIHADDRTAAQEKLRAIPTGNLKNWNRNANLIPQKQDVNKLPSLILTSRGAFINTYGYSQQSRIPFDQVLVALAALPKEAWPYGRLMTYYSFPPGIHLSTDREPPADMIKKVDADLNSVGMKFVPCMSQ